MSTDCIFCKIVADEIPATVIYKDEYVTAFRDINPVAPTHVLIIPNKHIPSTNELTPEDQPLMGYLLGTVRKVAEIDGIVESGYRLIINTGPDANQVVFHIHLHVIGGHRLKHPMG